MRTPSINITLAIALILAMSGKAEQALVSSKSGYSLSAPDNWSVIPSPEFASLVEDAFPIEVRNQITYEFGLLHESSEGLLSPPYCLIGIQLYSSGGIQGQPSIPRLQRIVSDSYGTQGMKESVQSSGGHITEAMIPREEDIKVEFDAGTLTCQVAAKIQNPSFGLLSTHSILFFGKKGFVTVSFFYKDVGESSAATDISRTLNSFRFTEEARYDPTIRAISPIERIIDKSIPAIVLGIIFSLIGYAYKRVRRIGPREQQNEDSTH